MLRWAPYPFVRITLGFIAGILLYLLLGKDFGYSAGVLAFFVALYLAAFLLARKYKSGALTDTAGILALLCFVAGGLWVTHLHTERHQPQHILHLPEKPSYYVGVVDDYVVQKPGYQRSVLELEQAQVNGIWQQAKGKVQVSVPHDSKLPYELTYGDRLLIKGAPQPLAAAPNPNQFDYSAYLANRNVYFRQFLRAHDYVKLGTAPANPVLYFSIRWRRQLEHVLRENIQQRREYAISSALILGITDELDNAIRSAYINTGTMHVLAVSGLHVGLIYGVLLLALAYFRRTPRQRLLSAIVVILALWFYAFMTGLSPSVLRSVVMFTLVTVAAASGRRTNIYNTLAIAAFALLLYNPYFLFEVGFQLSFLAVLGIVYLQPRFYRLLAFDNWLLDKVWILFTVSLAAQLITLPLGLLYFHQFPVYFWLANLVVVPLSTLALYTGLTALAFSWVPVLGQWLFKLHFGVIWSMNELNTGLTRLPQALISGIDITFLQTVLLYVLLVLFILFLSMKKLRYLSLAVVVTAILAGQQLVGIRQQKQQQTLAIYNVRRATGIAMVQGQHAALLADSALLHDEGNYTFNIQPHLWHLGVQQPQFVSLNSAPAANQAVAALPDSNRLVVWQGQRLLILAHPTNLQPRTQLPLNYILLRNNVRLKPDQLQNYTSAKVILDASNSPWYRQRLQQQLDTLGIAWYDVADSGAFVLQLGRNK